MATFTPDCESYNCDSLGTYDQTLEQCKLFRAGGVSKIIVLGCDADIADVEDEAEVQAAIDAGTAWEMPNLKVGWSAPSQVTAESVTACGSEVVVNNTYTGAIFDAKVSENNTIWYNKFIAGWVAGGMLLKICDTSGLSSMMVYVQGQISFSGGLTIPNTNKEYLRYEINFTFNSNDIQTLPANPIFD